MADSSFGLRIFVDGEKEFKGTLADIKQSFKGLGTELELAASQFDKQDKSTEALTARNEALAKASDGYKDGITLLGSELARLADSQGVSERTVKNYEITLNQAKTTLNEMERDLAANNRTLGDGIKQYDDNQQAIKAFTDRNIELTKEIDVQKARIDLYKMSLAEAVGQYGEHSAEAFRWRDAISNAKKTLGTMTDELDNNNEQIKKHSVTLADAVQKEEGHKKSVDDLTQTKKVLDSELKKVDAQYGKNNTSLDALTAKNKILTDSVSTQKEKIAMLRAGLEDATNSFGEADSRTKEWAVQLNNAETELIGMERELKSNNREIQANSTHIKELKDRKKELTGEIKTQKSEISDLRKGLSDSKSAYGENAEETKKWADKLDDAEKALGQLEGELSDTNGELKNSKTAFKEIRDGVDEFGNRADDAGKKSISLGDIIKGHLISDVIVGGFKALGDAIKSAFTGMVDAFKDVVNVGMEYENAFANIRKTVEATDDEFTELSDSLRDMSTEIPVSAAELANLGGIAGQLNIDKDNIVGFTRVMADMSVATNLAGEEGAAQLAKFANITKMSQDDFDKLGSSIVALGNNSATTEQDIMNMAMRLAGAGTSVGMSQADIAGLATALSAVGIEAEMGGSAVSKIMVRMSAAASTSGKFDAILSQTGMSLRDMQLLSTNNSKDFKGLADSLGMTSTELTNMLKNATDLENFGEVAGMTASDFKQAFEDDATGALLQFMQGLGDVEGGSAQAIEKLQEMGIVEVRLRDTLLRTANASELFSEAVALSNEAWAENSALTKEAEERYDTLENKIGTFKNNVDNFKLEVFEGMEDTLKSIVDLGTEYINELTTAFQEGGLDGLLSKVGDVLADIVGKISEHLPSIVKTATEIVGKIADTIIENLPILIPVAVQLITTLFAGLIENLPTIVGGAIQLILTLVDGIIEMLPALMEAAIQIIGAIIQGLTKAAPTLIPAIVEAVMLMITTLIENAPALIYAAIELITALADGLLASIPIILEMLPDLIQAIVDTAISLAPLLVVAGVQLFVALIKNLPAIIDGIIAAIPEILAAIGSGFLDGVSALADVGKQLLKGLGEGLIGAIDWIKEKITFVVGSVTGFFKDLFGIHSPSTVFADIGINLLKGLGNGITGAVSFVTGKISEVGSAIFGTIGGFIGGTVETGKNLMQGLGNGIANAADGVVNGAKKVGSSIINGVNNIFGVHSPSTVFAEIGGHLMTGLSLGIDKGEKAVLSSVDAIANDITDNIDGISPETRVLDSWVQMFESIKQVFKDIFNLSNDDSQLKQFEEIGKSIASNIGQGFKDKMSEVATQMAKALPSDFYTNAQINTKVIGVPANTNVNRGPLFTIQQMIVRSDDDIRRVSQELFNLMDRTSRSQGFVTVP